MRDRCRACASSRSRAWLKSASALSNSDLRRLSSDSAAVPGLVASQAQDSWLPAGRRRSRAGGRARRNRARSRGSRSSSTWPRRNCDVWMKQIALQASGPEVVGLQSAGPSRNPRLHRPNGRACTRPGRSGSNRRRFGAGELGRGELSFLAGTIIRRAPATRPSSSGKRVNDRASIGRRFPGSAGARSTCALVLARPPRQTRTISSS